MARIPQQYSAQVSILLAPASPGDPLASRDIDQSESHISSANKRRLVPRDEPSARSVVFISPLPATPRLVLLVWPVVSPSAQGGSPASGSPIFAQRCSDHCLSMGTLLATFSFLFQKSIYSGWLLNCPKYNAFTSGGAFHKG
ncbi:hypothetical protein WOLCODRAFT_148202 [Wolfiporia cocos MD-104 SS10]|uniref:Uncharacterized protein n=1 Tax=Wolfiporia cocos (strain MD-104) TaxID=742152 RepID=A0A2H3JDU8_WOLCO|nr:hypothetical protein WOLCODRAFT_148202 [Wolfiporia cocos MD-104 SS10]